MIAIARQGDRRYASAMAEVFFPWGVFALAAGLARLYLGQVRETLAITRFGRPSVDGRLWWLGALAVAALIVWPFFAAVWIDWPGRDPSFLTVVLMSGGAVVFGWAASIAVDVLAGAYVSTRGRQGESSFDVTEADIVVLEFLRRYRLVVWASLILLTMVCYLAIIEVPYWISDCFDYGYC